MTRHGFHQVNIPDDLYDAFEAYRTRHPGYATITEVIREALRDFLRTTQQVNPNE